MTPLLWSGILVLLAGGFLLSSVPIIVMVERWGSAWMQRRSGPNRVGYRGLMQPLSDAIKFVFKEENLPERSHSTLFILAPILAVLPPFVGFSVIPFADSIHLNGMNYPVQISLLSVSLLFLLAISSLHVFSVLMAGWASNNKFSLLGALRAGSQMISYEIAIGICIVSLVITYGTLDLREIVQLQAVGASPFSWGLFKQPLCFLILWICAFAECNRLPFDLPEGETELVAGYHTEYSGLKFALFFMGEYVAMFLASAFLATLFLGGYNVPFFSQESLLSFFQGTFGLSLTGASVVTSVLQIISLAAKVYFFMWVFIWVRWTLPRFRYDQLMDLGWKLLLPLGIFNVIFSLIYSYFGGWS